MKPILAELFRGKDRKHYLRFRYSNGQKLMTSEGYNSRRDARKLANTIFQAARELAYTVVNVPK